MRQTLRIISHGKKNIHAVCILVNAQIRHIICALRNFSKSQGNDGNPPQSPFEKGRSAQVPELIET